LTWSIGDTYTCRVCTLVRRSCEATEIREMKRTEVSGQVVADVCVRWYVNYSRTWNTGGAVPYKHVRVRRTNCGAPNTHFITRFSAWHGDNSSNRWQKESKLCVHLRRCTRFCCYRSLRGALVWFISWALILALRERKIVFDLLYIYNRSICKECICCIYEGS